VIKGSPCVRTSLTVPESRLKQSCDFLTYLLDAALLRLRLCRAIRLASLFLTAGTVAAALLLFTFPFPFWSFVPPGLFFAGLLIGLIAPVSRSKTAEMIDIRLGLRGRVITAQEIEEKSEKYGTAVAEVQRQDACEKLHAAIKDLPDALNILVPIRICPLVSALLFYGVFAVIPLTIPIDRFEKKPWEKNPTSPVSTALTNDGEGRGIKQEDAAALLNQTAALIDRIAENHSQIVPLRQLHQRAQELPLLTDRANDVEKVSVLAKWENSLTRTIEALSAERPRSEKVSESHESTEISNGAVESCASLLRKQLGKIIHCRLDVSESLSRDGGKGMESRDHSPDSWGSGGAAPISPTESLSADISEPVKEIRLTGTAAYAELFADDSDPAHPNPGISVLKREPVLEPIDSVSESPVLKEVIPEKRKELVKRYFDY
jgi:hypothetical protein